MKARHKIEENDAELALGLITCSNYLWTLFFFKEEISMEPTIQQKVTFCDVSRRILLCTSRHVAKTIGLRARLTKEMFTFMPNEETNKREEILFVTPAQVHMSQFINKFYADIDQQPLFKSLILGDKRRGDAPEFVTKTRLYFYGRIEGVAGNGRNMQGPHPRLVMGDEMEFTSTIDHQYRIAGAQPDARWIYAGVPNGLRNTPFYRLDTTKAGAKNWSRHKYNIKANPVFLINKKYRKELEEEYGGKDSPEYITQILGEWGDEAASSFPPGSVKWGTHSVYTSKTIYNNLQEAIVNNTLPSIIRVPQVQCYRAVCGWDFGTSPDPANFTIAVQYEQGAPWMTYARVALYQVPVDKQIIVLKYLWTSVMNYKCMMVSVDSQECYQMLNADENRFLFEGHCKETKQGGMSEVDVVTGRVITPETEHYPDVELHRKEKKIIKMGRKHFLTWMLLRYMANSIMESQTEVKLELGLDPDLESEMKSTVERRTEHHVVYVVPKMGKVNQDQCLDSLRAAVDGIVEIDGTMVLDNFNYEEMISALGWGGRANREDAFRPAWEL